MLSFAIKKNFNFWNSLFVLNMHLYHNSLDIRNFIIFKKDKKVINISIIIKIILFKLANYFNMFIFVYPFLFTFFLMIFINSF